METGTVAVNGAQLSYDAAGDGYPLVLLHAGAMDRRMWDAQFDLLAEEFRVVRYDARGSRGSDLPTEPFSLSADLRGLLEVLQVERCHLIGSSIGGRTALDFTIEYPEMVEALVLVGPGLGGYPFSQSYVKKFSKIFSAIEGHGIAGVVEAFLADPTLVPPKTLAAAREQVGMMLADNIRTFFVDPNLWRQLEPAAVARLSEVTVPTLIIVGERDDSDIHKIADLLEKEIRDAKKIVVNDAGHLVNLEQPVEFNRIVLGFLTSQTENIAASLAYK